MSSDNLKPYKSKSRRSLMSLYPDVAREWNYDKNGDLKPENVLPYSKKLVWWRSEDEREFQATVKSRTTNRNVRRGQYKAEDQTGTHKSREEKEQLLRSNSLAVKHPEIALQWDYDKNAGVKPEDVFEKSGKSFWFQCASGHSWRSTIINRTVKRSGCPVCLKESKKFSTKHQGLFLELNESKNLKPVLDTIYASSNDEVWWDCPLCKQSYLQTPKKRLAGYNCPNCEPRINPVPYDKSLAYLYPDIAKEWHPTLNGQLNPSNVRAKSGKMVWWQCSKDPEHQWQSLVHNRSQNRNGCPFCNRKKRNIKRIF